MYFSLFLKLLRKSYLEALHKRFVVVNDRKFDLIITGVDKLLPILYYPAGKYWSPGRPEDVPLQRLQDVP